MPKLPGLDERKSLVFWRKAIFQSALKPTIWKSYLPVDADRGQARGAHIHEPLLRGRGLVLGDYLRRGRSAIPLANVGQLAQFEQRLVGSFARFR